MCFEKSVLLVKRTRRERTPPKPPVLDPLVRRSPSVLALLELRRGRLCVGDGVLPRRLLVRVGDGGPEPRNIRSLTRRLATNRTGECTCACFSSSPSAIVLKSFVSGRLGGSIGEGIAAAPRSAARSACARAACSCASACVTPASRSSACPGTSRAIGRVRRMG